MDQLGAMERGKMHIDIGVGKPEIAPIRHIDPLVALALERALVSHPRDTEHSAVYVHVVAMLEVIVVRQESGRHPLARVGRERHESTRIEIPVTGL